MKITITNPTTTLNYAKNELSSYLLRLSLPSCELDTIEINIKTDKAGVWQPNPLWGSSKPDMAYFFVKS